MDDVADLLRHVAVDHHQGDVVYNGGEGFHAPTPAVVAEWHRLEHQPCGNTTTHLNHAHDEVSARRFGVIYV